VAALPRAYPKEAPMNDLPEVGMKVAAFARVLNINPATIKRWHRAGHIRLDLIGSNYFVPPDEQARILDEARSRAEARIYKLSETTAAA
jgi:hypothetical protein